MRRLYFIGTVGLLLSIATGLFYLHFARTNGQSAYVFVTGETLKALLTFTLVVLGGALIKGAIDASLEEQRTNRSHAEQSKERRTNIITEFAEIFSQFYSVRKLYESARSHPQIYDLGSEEYSILVKELLKKSVELEGRYGALKIIAINHFGLPDSDLSAKNINELEKHLIEERNTPTSIRLRFDLLGEFYDDWRHALEGKRMIGVGRQVWENYEALLKYLMKD